MRWNFRLGWFRIEILPRFRIVFDVRRTVNKRKKQVDWQKRGQAQVRKAQAYHKKAQANYKRQARKRK